MLVVALYLDLFFASLLGALRRLQVFLMRKISSRNGVRDQRDEGTSLRLAQR
jgi:hypothetical protein